MYARFPRLKAFDSVEVRARGVCASMSLCVFYVGTILRCAVLSLSTLSYMFLFGVFDFCTLTGNAGMGQVQMRASKR